MQADMLTMVILPFSLFLIMFGMGLSLQPIDFKAIFIRPKAMGIGIVGQLLILPLLAFLLANTFTLTPEISVGLMILALAPGGATSNMFSYLAKGDVALSISLTAVISLVTPFTIPLVTAFSMSHFIGDSANFELPLIKTIVQLLVITIVPVALGMLFRHKWPTPAQTIESKLKWFSVFFMFLIIALIIRKNSANMMNFFYQAGIATLSLNLIVLFIGYQLARFAKLSTSQATSISFEVGIQNGTLAMVVAGSIIGNETMMIPGVTYGLLMFVTGGGLAWWLNKNQSTDGLSSSTE